MLVEGSLIALAILAWRKAGEKGRWTAEREEVYLQALEHLKDPAKLRVLANAFEKEGFHVKALALRKRADLRGASETVKKARAEALAKGVKSTNIPGILKLADAFEEITATGAAAQLRKRVVQLRIEASQKANFPPKETITVEAGPMTESERKIPTIPAPPPDIEEDEFAESTATVQEDNSHEIANGQIHAE